MNHKVGKTTITNYIKIYDNNKIFNVKVIDTIDEIVDIEVSIEPTTEERMKIHKYIIDLMEAKR